MTLITDNDFKAIDKIYTEVHGYKWLSEMGTEKYLKILEEYKELTKKEKEDFARGELVF